MIRSTIFAGHGGQGVMLMGYVLSHAAMAKGLNVTYIPAYGPEMRGGTANCTVMVSDQKIDSPVTDEPDLVVAMNPPSLEKFCPMLIKGGVALLNSSLIKEPPARQDIDTLMVPSLELAREAGSERGANMVVIGAFAACSGLLSLDETIVGMKRALKGKDKFFPLNEKALALGFSLAEK